MFYLKQIVYHLHILKICINDLLQFLFLQRQFSRSIKTNPPQNRHFTIDTRRWQHLAVFISFLLVRADVVTHHLEEGRELFSLVALRSFVSQRDLLYGVL